MKKTDDMQISIIKEKVINLFERLERTDKEDSKEKIVNDFTLKKYMIDRYRYPEIRFNITKNDIRLLKENNILDNDYNISPNFASENNSMDILSKLLYAILWKNGDLGKEHNVIKGIIHDSEDKINSGIVFYQFGKYLADHSEPIIDQHVIRCFLIKSETQNTSLIKYIHLNKIDKNYNEIVNKYRFWVNKIIKKGKYSTKDIDEVLFAFGKYIKKEGRKLTTAST